MKGKRYGWNRADEVMRSAYESLHCAQLFAEQHGLSTKDIIEARWQLARISAHAVNQLREFERPSTWRIVWSPEGRTIATVQAKTARAAIRKAPMPYRKYKGEMYALLMA